MTARGATHTLRAMFSLITYMALIVGVNCAFAVTPPITLPNGDLWPPVSLIVGFVFVVRDFAQRRVGHHVLWAMLAGCVASWYMASPELALASAAAFAVGELADWALFTFTRKSFSRRILISSLLGAPLDSLVFLLLIGLATPWSVLTMSLSKLAGSFLVFFLVRRREQREAGAEAA
ncbi:VUT family protein [Desulfovibrio sp. ZJ369]|uniref:VUT family protein n=1 Tax=Desulfovibrio sp. ZJ369 TaxID=2709793 RepID=UPI001981FEB4|nr:VUT family protein [Desulfovibrio sp. ZJ369]